MRHFTEIEFEWQTLHDLKRRVPEFSRFGGNNHDAINCQLEVLSECLGTDDVDEKNDAAQEGSVWADNDNYVAAMNAAEWIEGERDEPPSADWKAAAQ